MWATCTCTSLGWMNSDNYRYFWGFTDHKFYPQVIIFQWSIDFPAILWLNLHVHIITYLYLVVLQKLKYEISITVPYWWRWHFHIFYSPRWLEIWSGPVSGRTSGCEWPWGAGFSKDQWDLSAKVHRLWTCCWSWLGFSPENRGYWLRTIFTGTREMG